MSTSQPEDPASSASHVNLPSQGPEAEAFYIEGLRRMSGEERLLRAFRLTEAARSLAAVRIRAQYGPDLSERELYLRLGAVRISGRFDSAQEVVREGLHLLHERAIVDRERRERLDLMIDEGLSQLDRGEGIPGDQVFGALREKSRKRREAR